MIGFDAGRFVSELEDAWIKGKVSRETECQLLQSKLNLLRLQKESEANSPDTYPLRVFFPIVRRNEGIYVLGNRKPLPVKDSDDPEVLRQEILKAQDFHFQTSVKTLEVFLQNLKKLMEIEATPKTETDPGSELLVRYTPPVGIPNSVASVFESLLDDEIIRGNPTEPGTYRNQTNLEELMTYFLSTDRSLEREFFSKYFRSKRGSPYTSGTIAKCYTLATDPPLRR